MAHIARAIAAVQNNLRQHLIAVMPSVAAVIVGWGRVFAIGQRLLPIGLAGQVGQVATGAVLCVKRLPFDDVYLIQLRQRR